MVHQNKRLKNLALELDIKNIFFSFFTLASGLFKLINLKQKSLEMLINLEHLYKVPQPLCDLLD